MNNEEKSVFLKKLSYEDGEQLVNTLDNFRKNPDVNLFSNVIKLLESNKKDVVKNYVLDLCQDSRTQPTAFAVFDYAYNTNNNEIKTSLLSLLWQTGVDFSEKAHQIADIMLDSNDFQTIFEAFTLLENCTENLDAKIAGELYDRAKNATENAPDFLKSLFENIKAYLLVKHRNQFSITL